MGFNVKKITIISSISCCLTACLTTLTPQPAIVKTKVQTPAIYQDETQTIDVRVNDLIAQMSLEEKVSQMFDKSPAIPRLGIAEYNWWNEALHGVARAGKATVFPQAIGLAATFDENLVYKVATAISDEGRAKHHAFLKENNHSMYTGLTYWSPNINIFRDPRWGRGQETYGEDPYLTTRTAINFINGLQGDDSKYLKSVATLKHYAVHSGPEVSRHSDDYTATPKDLTETYLPAFKQTIKETHVSSVMCAYNSVNGTPACGNNELIQNKLRNEFQFSGYIVSDCGAIADFYDPKSHHIVDTPAEAAAIAVNTGTDLNCGDHHGNTYSYLVEAVNKGLIDESKINLALKRLFTARFKLGMFDKDTSHRYKTIPLTTVGSPEHIQLTLEAAEKSLVLLKNDGILPLTNQKKIALIGPNANNSSILVGNYHGKPVNPVTPKQALETKLGKKNVFYSPGSSLTGQVYSHFEAIAPNYFSHINYKGEIKPGLIAEYYPASHFGIQPALRRIDSNIDFSFTRSPIDNSSEQDLAIKWQGIFTPTETANYEFQNKNISFTLDGEAIWGSKKLIAGRQYQFSAESKLHAFWHSNVIEPEIRLSWLNKDINLKQEAIAAAQQADIIVFIGGITANLEGEEMPLELDGFSHGDRTHINLPKSQEDLLKSLKKLNKPIVYVNMSGSAIALNWAQDNVNAIIQGFYPGEQTGNALSNLLFGEYSPSGKLPITFYKNISDLPDFKDYSMSNRTYKYYEGDVLYPFGYGLTYTKFEYSNLQLAKQNNGDLMISANITNIGQKQSEEVVQIYLAMPDTPNKSPIRQLVSFERKALAAGQNKNITIKLKASQLQYVDDNGTLQPYKGRLHISVGSGQPWKNVPTVQKSILL